MYPAASAPASAPAEEKSIEQRLREAGIPAETARRYAQMIAASPEFKEMLIQHDPLAAKALAEDQPSEPAPTGAAERLAALRKAEERRRRARLLVGRLAEASDSALPALAGEIYQLGADAMVPLKLAELSDNFELRRRARTISVRLRWRLVVPKGAAAMRRDAVEIMSGSDRKARNNLVDSIATEGDAQWLGFLTECLADGDVYVRQRALDGLVKTVEAAPYDRRTVLAGKVRKQLEEMLVDDDQDMRLLAIGAMMRIRQVDITRLGALLDDESMEVRATVIKAMGYSRNVAAIKFILPLLEDPQWRIRAAALEALDKLINRDQSDSVAAHVARRLADEEDFVRALAAKILGDWSRRETGKTLLAMIKEDKLSEEAGFMALASMKDSGARIELLKRYRQAKEPERRAALLGYLCEYGKNFTVDGLLRQALKDEAMQTQWAKLISLAGSYERWESFYATLSGLLLQADDKVAQAAWQAVQYRADEKELPRKIVSKLLEMGDGKRGTWAIKAVYRWNGSGAMKVYRRGLEHPAGEVVALSLGAIGEDLLGEKFGADLPDYRRNRNDRRFPGWRGAKSPTRPTGRLPQSLVKSIAERLAHAAAPVRTRAAAMLYLDEAQTDEAVTRILRTALASKDPDAQVIALAGIVRDPKPFLAEMDLTDLARRPQTSQRALTIIAELGASEYLPVLMELGAKAGPDNKVLMKLLIRHGSDEAIELVVKKFAKVEIYEFRSLLTEELKGMAGAGAVKLLRHALTWPKIRKESYTYRQVVEVLLTLPDPSAKDALVEALDYVKKSKSNDWEFRDLAAKISVRLAELDPATGRARLREALTSGKADEEETLLQSILASRPNAETEKMLLEILRDKGDAAGGSWPRVIGWVSAEGFRKHFLPAMGAFHWAIQREVLDRVAEGFVEFDLDRLRSLVVKNPYLQQYLAALLGVLTGEDESQRKALAGALGKSPPTALLAVGDWPDAPRVLGPWLNDSRPEIAAAARAALAYHVLGSSEGQFDDSHRQALLSAVRGGDPFAAYLAAEALGAKWPAELGKLDISGIGNSAVGARVILARGDQLTDVQRAKLNVYLSGGRGKTAARLAVAAATRAYHPDLRPDPTALLQTESATMEALIELALAADDETLLRPLLRVIPPDQRRGVGGLAQRLIAKARTSDPGLFVTLTDHGWIDRPVKADLDRLLELAFMFRDEQHFSSYSSGLPPAPLALERAISWSSSQADEALTKKVFSKDTSGILAAAIAWSNWDDASAREVLLTAATTKLADKAEPQRRQKLAVAALTMKLDPKAAQALLDFAQTLSDDSWQQRELASRIYRTVALSQPRGVLDILKARNDEGTLYELSFDVSLLWRQLTATLADEERLPALNSWRRHGGSEQVALLAISDLLTESPRPTTQPADEAELTASEMSPQEIAARLLPPWDWPGEAGAGAIGSAQQARQALDRLIETLRWRARLTAKAHRGLAALQDGKMTREVIEEIVSVADGGTLLLGGGALPAEVEVASPGITDITIEEGVTFGMSRAGELSEAGAESDLLVALVEDEPEMFYRSWESLPQVALHLGAEELAGSLRPLLAGIMPKDPQIGLRLAAALRVESMADDIARHLRRQRGEQALEAAWSLAVLREKAAVGDIEKAYRRDKDFNTRLRLACLLRLLGSEAGRGEIDRALALWITRRFRLIFIQRIYTGRTYSSYRRPGRGLPPAEYIVSEGSSSGGLDERMFPWGSALMVGAEDLLRQAEGRYVLPRAPGISLPPRTENTQVRSDLDRLWLEKGRLAAPSLQSNELPLEALVLEEVQPSSLAFARLCAAEQDLESHFFVQFADVSGSLVELRRRWLNWWQANRHKSRRQWWRQAITQAVAELTHKRWWHRVRAARRLMRLTGREAAPPAVFDLTGWGELQSQWRDRLAKNSSTGPARWLMAEGVAAGVLPAGAAADADEAAAYRAHLIRLAGFAPQERLAQAALLQLEAMGPGSRELALEAVSWQRSPRRQLAVWVRERLDAIAKTNRLFYKREDFPAPAPATTAPAGP